MRSAAGKRHFIKVLLVSFVILLGYAVMGGCGLRSGDEPSNQARKDIKPSSGKSNETSGPGIHDKGLATDKNISYGKQLFKNLCAGCHGENARGRVGPDLTVSRFKYGKNRLDLTKSISQGRPGGMPAFSSQISRHEIELLVEYILSLK